MCEFPGRRHFIKQAALTIAGASLHVPARAQAPSPFGTAIYRRLVGANDASISDQGTVAAGARGFSARGTANQLQMWAAAYCAPESRYYRSAALVRRMQE